MQRILSILLVAAASSASMACAFLLPVKTDEVHSRWHSFDEAKATFDRITPGVTMRAELGELGYDPYEAPNVEILDFIGVLKRLLPENPSVPLPKEPGIEACIAAAQRCSGLWLRPSFTKDKEYGTAILSVLQFRHQNEITGWSFSAIVVLVDDEVVYKLWGGNPGVRKYKDEIHPLGPLQQIDLDPGLF